MPAPSTRHLPQLLYKNTHAFTQSQRFATGIKAITRRVGVWNRLAAWATGIKVTGNRANAALQRSVAFLVAIKQIPRVGLLFPLEFPLLWAAENLKVWNGLRPVSWATGIKVTGSRVHTGIQHLILSALYLVGIKSISRRVVTTTKTTKWNTGIKVTGKRAATAIRTTKWNTGIKVTGSRLITALRPVKWNTGIKSIPKKIAAFTRTTAFAVGIKVTGKRLVTAIRSYLYHAGIKVTGSKVYTAASVAIIKTALFLVGIKAIPIKLATTTQTTKWAVGIKSISKRAIASQRFASFAVGIKITGSRTINVIRNTLVKIGIKFKGLSVYIPFPTAPVVQRAIHLIGQGIIHLWGVKYYQQGATLKAIGKDQPIILRGNDVASGLTFPLIFPLNWKTITGIILKAKQIVTLKGK